ncbi:MAG: hypothetical protein UT34_C0002G0336 [candidate division WS6 bacterium GW2011_GWF2_39_15]|uniref:N-acetyltransferase domain-containing protein n=1 Tax=candidate division WS6 bacterium GW2011_GWF2_39_15 TaxID=1619100 RepID=A0A0G0MP35_9BACT|nr:MAG: hypothetical protein UT34_C0002G0336 [candidate division WS6 bacterium GW2011_GWF2_39_15]
MIEIHYHKFSDDFEVKLQEIENYIIPIYLKVWKWNFTLKSYEDRLRYTSEFHKAQRILTLNADEKSVGYLIYDIKKVDDKTWAYLREIDILEEYRGRGYSELLYDELLKRVEPDIIYGEAQNPISAKARNKGLSKYGYSTYWCEEPLSKNSPVSERIKEISRLGVELFDNENLKSYTAGVKEFTKFNDRFRDYLDVVPEYRSIFMKIKNISKTKYQSAFGVLISIKNSIIINYEK